MLGDDLLQGDLVKLTEPRPEDVAPLARWFNSMEYQRYLRRGQVSPVTEKGLGEWILKDEHEDMFLFVIRPLPEERPIGLCAIDRIQWQARHCEVFIGIADPAERGKGCGTDAMHVLLKYAFMEMNLNRVGLVVGSYNLRAAKSYEKCGFQREGVIREAVFRDGVYYDMIQMGILRREWEQMYAAR